MDRETKKIKTPSGKEAELKTYLTTRERNELREIFLQNMKVETDGSVKEGISGAVIQLAEKKLIELAVVSYDGNSERILERLLDGAPQEYDFIVAEANRINTGNFQTAK